MNIQDVVRRLIPEFRSAHPSIKDDDFKKIWLGVEDKVNSEPPPRIALLGEAGVGKSSTINALFNAGAAISHTEACTQTEQIFEITRTTIDGEKGVLHIYDMPGLGESRKSSARHQETYSRILSQADVVLWVLDARYRAIENVQNHLVNVISKINPNLMDRMVIGLNKIDQVHPGELDWHPKANVPSHEQELNIKKRSQDVENKIREEFPHWKGKIIPYSANKRYNLPQLFSAMIDAVDIDRQWVVASRKSLANFLAMVDPELLKSGNSDSFKIQESSQKPPKIQKTLDLIKNIEQLSDADYANLVKDKSTLIEILKSIKQWK